MHYRMIVKWIPFIGETIMRTLLNVIKFLGKFLLFILTSSVLGLQVDAEILDKFPKRGKDEVF